jgi:hypothetical protein
MIKNKVSIKEWEDHTEHLLSNIYIELRADTASGYNKLQSDLEFNSMSWVEALKKPTSTVLKRISAALQPMMAMGAGLPLIKTELDPFQLKGTVVMQVPTSEAWITKNCLNHVLYKTLKKEIDKGIYILKINIQNLQLSKIQKITPEGIILAPKFNTRR